MEDDPDDMKSNALIAQLLASDYDQLGYGASYDDYGDGEASDDLDYGEKPKKRQKRGEDNRHPSGSCKYCRFETWLGEETAKKKSDLVQVQVREHSSVELCKQTGIRTCAETTTVHIASRAWQNFATWREEQAVLRSNTMCFLQSDPPPPPEALLRLSSLHAGNGKASGGAAAAGRPPKVKAAATAEGVEGEEFTATGRRKRRDTGAKREAAARYLSVVL